MNEPIIEEESVMFKNLVMLLKKGWLRIITYIMVAILIVSLLLVGLNLMGVTIEYQSKITFNNDYILSGMSPWNSTFDVNGIAKSNSVLTAALTDCGYSDEQISTLIDVLIKNVSVTADTTLTTTNDEEYAYVFNVALTKTNELKLSESQYKALVDAITNQTINAVRSQYSYSIDYISFSDIDYTNTNFVQAYDALNAKLTELEITLTELTSISSSFRSTTTKQTFADISANLSTIKIDLESLKAYLITNAVVNTTNEWTSEKDYIDQKVSSLTESTTNTKNRIDELATLIKEIKPDYVLSSTLTVENISNNSSFYELVALYNSLQTSYVQECNEKVVWENLKTSYAGSLDTTESSNTKVKAMLNATNTAMATIYSSTKTGIDEYNNVELLKMATKKTTSATKVETKLISNVLFVIIDLIVVVLAIAIALIVTDKTGESLILKANKVIDKTEVK